MTAETSPNTPSRKERLQQLVVEYGSLALWVYFGIFVIVLVGFAAAIGLGIDVESTAGTVGVWGAAYVATKLTLPLRILATLALTPVVVHVIRRSKRR
jgi:hypothetical protein